MKNILTNAFFVSLFFISSSIVAQDSAEIEEVIVTATKTESNAQDVPMVITTFTASEIEDRGILNARDIGSQMPSLIVNYNVDPMNSSMRIRGIGTSQSDAALESDVALVVDGVYLNKTGLALNDLVDIERIEVLQGPQGTLYGKNTNAGVVNIITKKPISGETDGYVKYEAGDYGQQRMLAAASFGLSDSLAMRISANVNEMDGYMTNIVDGSKANGVDDSVVALKLSYDKDDLNIFFSHTEISKDSTCCAVDSLNTSTQSQIGHQLFAADPLVAVQDTEFNNYRYAATPGYPSFELDSSLTSLKIDKEMENGTLTMIVARNDYMAFREWDADFTSLRILDLERKLPGESTTHEIRYSSNMMGDIEYTVGAFFLDADYGEAGTGPNKEAIIFGDHYNPILQSWLGQLTTQITGLVTIQAQGGTLTPLQAGTLAALQGAAAQVGALAQTTLTGDGIAQDMNWHDETQAIFGRVTKHFNETTRATFGLRYTTEDKTADLYANTVLPGTTVLSAAIAGLLGQPQLAGSTVPRQLVLGDNWPLSAFLQNVDDVFERTDSATSWSLSVQKDIADDIMVYASAATGYKSGGFNSTSGDTGDAREYDKTESTNFEIGIKSRLLNNRVQLNAAIFDFETEGQQGVTQSATGTGTIVYNATVPAERFGYDISLIAKLTPKISFNASVLSIDDNDPDPEANAAARFTPDDAYAVGLSFNQPLSGGMLFARIDYSYDEGNYQNTSIPIESPRWTATPGYPELSEPIEVENMNLKVGWRNDNLEMAYSVKNATDETWTRLVLVNSGVSGVKGMMMARPEMSTFSIKYNF